MEEGKIARRTSGERPGGGIGNPDTKSPIQPLDDPPEEPQNSEDDDADSLDIEEPDSGEEDKDQPQDELIKTWENDVQEALKLEEEIDKEKCDRKEAKRRRKDFCERLKHNWIGGKKGPRGHNFLHFLASNQDVKSEKLLAYFVAHAVPICAKQVGEFCDDPQAGTPITMAITSCNDTFVNAIRQMKRNREMVREHLLQEAKEGIILQGLTTCLHAAIDRGVKNNANPRKDALNTTNFQGILELVPSEAFFVINPRGQSPLRMVISFMRDVADEVISIAPEDAFLSKDSSRGWTPLHAAVAEDYSARLIIVRQLVEKCPKALMEQDLMGRTPLHLAVEYDRCSEEQLALVNFLILKGPGALKANLSTTKKLSPFQYHEHTRQQAKARTPTSTKERMRLSGVRGKELVSGIVREVDIKLSIRLELKKTDKASRKDREVYNGAAPNSSMRRASIGSASRETTIFNVPSASSTMDPPMHAKAAPVVGTTGALNEKWAEEIRDRLKLEYLRSMKPQEALRFLSFKSSLRVHEPEKLFWLDFGPKPLGILTEEGLNDQFGHLNFDNVLKYLAVPRIDLDKHKEAKAKDGKGRDDLTILFQWLRARKVRHIVRLEVDDMESPHNDEAIETALRDFSITILDWKKPDLCPYTLSRANISSLEEIHLYWSGRNPVLYGWSETGEGLSRIQTLKTVVIHQIEQNESLERTKMYIKNFKDRMSAYKVTHEGVTRARTKLGFSEVGVSGLSSSSKKPEGSTPHQWLSCMEDFAERFKNIPGLTDIQEDSNLNCVKIALIDDGCEPSQVKLRGTSFNEYRTHDRQWRVSPYWQSASGHGTLMERLIRRICPSADIYVIRLKTFDTVDSRKIQIDPQSATEAIRHAIAAGVHVISMSWTIKPPEDPSVRVEFEKAIHEAEQENILMFCSASDQGKFPDESYPYSASVQHIFRIGAADAMGMTSKFVDEAKVDFIFPGEDVTIDKMLSNDIQDRDSESFKAMAYTGSSVATALAAGLAALVYECVRLGVLHSLEQTDGSFPLKVAELKNLRKKEQMNTVFKRIGQNTGRNDKYINVWQTFKDGFKLLEDADTRDEKMAAIAQIARVKLVSRI